MFFIQRINITIKRTYIESIILIFTIIEICLSISFYLLLPLHYNLFSIDSTYFLSILMFISQYISDTFATFLWQNFMLVTEKKASNFS